MFEKQVEDDENQGIVREIQTVKRDKSYVACYIEIRKKGMVLFDVDNQNSRTSQNRKKSTEYL